jgi:hypothetical protein
MRVVRSPQVHEINISSTFDTSHLQTIPRIGWTLALSYSLLNLQSETFGADQFCPSVRGHWSPTPIFDGPSLTPLSFNQYAWGGQIHSMAIPGSQPRFCLTQCEIMRKFLIWDTSSQT